MCSHQIWCRIVVMDAATLVREARARHGIGQAALARRARTSQAQISRIERGEISPSVSTLARLLEAMAERLELSSAPMPHGNRSDEDAAADAALSPAERVASAAALSRALTSIASSRRR
jgi:transcriptional regulator with XRE-family HTH domain